MYLVFRDCLKKHLFKRCLHFFDIVFLDIRFQDIEKILPRSVPQKHPRKYKKLETLRKSGILRIFLYFFKKCKKITTKKVFKFQYFWKYH